MCKYPIIFHKNRLLQILLLVGLMGCASSKEWREGEYLLRAQEVKPDKKLPIEQFTPYFRQKPNASLLGFFPTGRVWAYYRGKRRFDPDAIQAHADRVERGFNRRITQADNEQKTKKVARLERRKRRKTDKIRLQVVEGNWLMRVMGEPPVFVDSLTVEKTAEQMRRHLREEKGFFEGNVAIEREYYGDRRARIIYQIIENAPTFWGNYTYITDNAEIDTLLKKTWTQRLVREGEYFEVATLRAEQARVEKLLRNQGFFYFKRQYARFDVDTNHFAKQDSLWEIARHTDSTLARPKRLAHIKLVIDEPSQGNHKSWRLAKIYFHTVNLRRRVGAKDTLYSPETDIAYTYESRRLNYSYRVFDQRIKLKPGALYADTYRDDTQRLVGSMDLFKYISLNIDTTQRGLEAHIYTQPHDRYQFTNEIGFNVIQGLPGPFINFSLKNRNSFAGGEIFETNLRFAIDGQTSFSAENRFYSSIEAGATASLTFPRLLFPRRLIVPRLRDNIENYGPTTRLSLGYNFVRRPEYTRTNLTGAITYKGQLRNSTYNLTLAELSLVNTTSISPFFQEQLLILQNQGNPIINSFARALVTSIYFMYTFNNNPNNETKRSHYIRFLAETGGNTLSLLNESPFKTGSQIFGLNYFQYWRANLTMHYYMPLNDKYSLLVFRVNGGIAKPYGYSTTLPYEKFFFAGGGNSVRAWRPRRLGIGASAPQGPEGLQPDGSPDYRFEQPGEVILEGNVEYRFPLLGSWIRGGLFVDAGNVWRLEEDANRPGSKFQFGDFASQLAIGTGFGVRLNLPFLLLRFDLGIKAYDPVRAPGERWLISRITPWEFGRNFQREYYVLNLAIGYPF